MVFTKKRFKTFSIFFTLILSFLTFQAFQVSSNLFLLLPQEGEVSIDVGEDWKRLNPDIKGFSAKTEFQNGSFTVSQVLFRRNHPSFLQRQVSKLLPGKIKIVEITPENEFMIIADPDSKFKSMNTSQAHKNSSANFVLNANFYGTKNQILGELILDGHKYNNETKDSGFFRVINHSPYVGPRSYINSIPGDIQYSCQAFPSVINQGQIFSYIKSEKRPSKPLWKKKTYRNLVGRKKNGNIVFILSNQRGFLSVKEITYIAKLLDLDTAALFDGGRALQYSLDHADYSMSFAAFNNSISLGYRLDDYFMRKYKTGFIQQSPVFIGVKLH